MRKPAALAQCSKHADAKKAAKGRTFAVFIPFSPITARPEQARVGLGRVLVALKADAPATPGIQVNQQHAVPLFMMPVRSTHRVLPNHQHAVHEQWLHADEWRAAESRHSPCAGARPG